MCEFGMTSQTTSNQQSTEQHFSHNFLDTSITDISEYLTMEDISGFITISEPVGIQRALQDQDGITTNNDCYISGDFNICPAGADFSFGDSNKHLNAQLSCPLDAVQQSDFREASQKGLCTCDATIRDVTESEDAAVPLACQCFICPSQENQFGVAYYCESPIAGNCLSFNCAGECNGDPDTNFIINDTKAPTAAPVESISTPAASAFNTHPTLATTAVVLLCLARMFR